MASKDKVTISVRLQPELAKRVKRLAKLAGRSASSMIEWIMSDRIADEEKIVKSILKGMKDAREGRVMDAEEFFEQLERESAEKGARHDLRKRSA